MDCQAVAGQHKRAAADGADPSAYTAAPMRHPTESGVDQIWSSVYRELHTLAARHLAGERRNHTLQPTALVHEAFLRLRADRASGGIDRAAFCRAAAGAMRRILVDHARARLRQKRAVQDGFRVALDDEVLASEADAIRLLELEDAVTKLEVVSARRAEVVRLRYFAGLTEEETAEVLGVCRRTIQNEFRSARAWLRRAMGGCSSESPA